MAQEIKAWMEEVQDMEVGVRTFLEDPRAAGLCFRNDFSAVGWYCL